MPIRKRKESYDYSFVWVDTDGEMHWDIYNDFTKNDAESICKAERKFKEVLHAESNAITKLSKSTQSSANATMYITISPCVECAKLIIQSGIERVVYEELYRDDKGINLLERARIQVDQHERIN